MRWNFLLDFNYDEIELISKILNFKIINKKKAFEIIRDICYNSGKKFYELQEEKNGIRKGKFARRLKKIK